MAAPSLGEEWKEEVEEKEEEERGKSLPPYFTFPRANQRRQRQTQKHPITQDAVRTIPKLAKKKKRKKIKAWNSRIGA